MSLTGAESRGKLCCCYCCFNFPDHPPVFSRVNHTQYFLSFHFVLLFGPAGDHTRTHPRCSQCSITELAICTLGLWVVFDTASLTILASAALINKLAESNIREEKVSLVHNPDRSPFLQGNQGRNSHRQSHLPHSEEQRRRDPSLSATQLAFFTLRESRTLAIKQCHPHSGSSCSQQSRQTPIDSPTGQLSLENSSLGLSSQHLALVGVNSRSTRATHWDPVLKTEAPS